MIILKTSIIVIVCITVACLMMYVEYIDSHQKTRSPYKDLHTPVFRFIKNSFFIFTHYFGLVMMGCWMGFGFAFGVCAFLAILYMIGK